MNNDEMWARLPDWPAWEVVAVSVVGPQQVQVRHQDGTEAVHEYAELTGVLEPLRDPQVFATAQVWEGTLSWVVDGGETIDVAADALWLHAHGFCDGSCRRQAESGR